MWRPTASFASVMNSSIRRWRMGTRIVGTKMIWTVDTNSQLRALYSTAPASSSANHTTGASSISGPTKRTTGRGERANIPG